MSASGASSTVLEVVVPYSRTSMVQLIGKVFSTPLEFKNEKKIIDFFFMATKSFFVGTEIEDFRL